MTIRRFFSALLMSSLGALFSAEFSGNGISLVKFIKMESGQFCILDDPSLGFEQITINRQGKSFSGFLRDLTRDTPLSVGMRNGNLHLRRRTDPKTKADVLSAEETILIIERVEGVDEVSVLGNRLFYPNGIALNFVTGKNERLTAKAVRKERPMTFRIEGLPQIPIVDGTFLIESNGAFTRQEVARTPVMSGTYQTRLGEINVATKVIDGGDQKSFISRLTFTPSNADVEYALLEVSVYNGNGETITSRSTAGVSGKHPAAELTAMAELPENGTIVVFIGGDQKRKAELEIKP